MPYLSRASVESIAQRVITAYKRLPALRNQQVDHIQPELLVRDLLGLTVEYHKLSRYGTVLGLTACGEVGIPVFDDPEHPEYCFLDGKTLLIEQNLVSEGANVGRYHFTLVHEACHQIYKMLFPREYLSGPQARKVHCCSTLPVSENDRWEEWRTNALASAVLMPADIVRGNMQAFGLGDRLEMLNKVFAPNEYRCFSEMVGHMGVSKQALALRMKQLGVLGTSYLQDPYALVAIYPDEETEQRRRDA